MKLLQAIIILLLGLSQASVAEKIKLKNVANFKGVRDNILQGYGLVYGLAKTGDTQASATSKASALKLLHELGVKAEPEELVYGNFASVLVTATLPPFARIGDQIDIRISANGDATSLAGGTLIQTPLRGPDREIYGIAQGTISVGQVSGKGASILTIAYLPKAATVEKEFIPEFIEGNTLFLSLKQADFTTNARVVTTINNFFHGFYAKSIDPVRIEVKVPDQYQDKVVPFIAKMESLEVDVDTKAVVVVNERTATIVMGADVRILPTSIAHGNLTISVGDGKKQGKDGKAASMLEVKGSSVGEIVKSLNLLGAKPDDLIGILQALSASGALQGELKFI